MDGWRFFLLLVEVLTCLMLLILMKVSKIELSCDDRDIKRSSKQIDKVHIAPKAVSQSDFESFSANKGNLLRIPFVL